MVRRAIADNPHFEISLREMNADGYTYTYRTLEKLKEEYPDTDFYFIIGADSLFSFDDWREPGRIARACRIVVAVRNQSSRESLILEMDRLHKKYNGEFLLLDTTNIDISSHMLRSWQQEGKSLKYYVPDPVIAYIEEQHIYQ